MYLGIKIRRVAELYSAWLAGMRVHAWNDVDDNDYVDETPALIGTCNQSKARNTRRYSRGFSTDFEMKYSPNIISHWTRRNKLVKQLGAVIPPL